MKKKIKNPLRRRILRELKSDITKYLVIFFIMILAIGFCSGYDVAGNSMTTSYYEGFEKYNIEDGNFLVQNRLNMSQKADVEALGVALYDLFYVNRTMSDGDRFRIYANRYEADKLCLMKGTWPAAADEIVVDRLYANNNQIEVGDTVETEDGIAFRVTGYVAFPDYSCLFENNSDTMFDSLDFCVAAVTNEGFARFDEDLIKYDYAWTYNEKPQTESGKKEAADDFLEGLKKIVTVKNYLPAYINQAINFTIEDIGSDSAMMRMLGYILVAIIAFIFAVTSKNTIVKESMVIGTLRATGFTRGELLRHYLTLPVVVSLVSSLVGNILGYTSFKDFCAKMYYGSYSLFTYRTIWTPSAFIETTIVPLVIMIVINLFILQVNLKKPILAFLRGDLTKGKKKKALRLPHAMRIMGRFRLRVIFSNISSFVVIFIGALFANLILLFGLALPQVLSSYEEKLPNSMLATYQYMLTMPVEESYANKLEETMGMLSFLSEVSTENEDAEKFSAYALKSNDPNRIIEDVTVYGVVRDSRYVNISHNTDGIVISRAFSDKYELYPGDEVTLHDEYELKDYTFTVADVYPYDASIVAFLDIDRCNEVFDLGEGTFVGYFSDSEITDIDEKYIGSVIDLESLSKVTRQLKNTMGNMMYAVDVLAVIIFIIVVYLLFKLIIEKNTHPISVTRILGYNSGEIGNIYVISLSIAVVISFLISIWIDYTFLVWVYKIMIGQMMAGWLPLDVKNDTFLKMIAMGLGAYVLVALREYGRIAKIPMDIALKTVE